MAPCVRSTRHGHLNATKTSNMDKLRIQHQIYKSVFSQVNIPYPDLGPLMVGDCIYKIPKLNANQNGYRRRPSPCPYQQTSILKCDYLLSEPKYPSKEAYRLDTTESWKKQGYDCKFLNRKPVFRLSPLSKNGERRGSAGGSFGGGEFTGEGTPSADEVFEEPTRCQKKYKPRYKFNSDRNHEFSDDRSDVSGSEIIKVEDSENDGSQRPRFSSDGSSSILTGLANGDYGKKKLKPPTNETQIHAWSKALSYVESVVTSANGAAKKPRVSILQVLSYVGSVVSSNGTNGRAKRSMIATVSTASNLSVASNGRNHKRPLVDGRCARKANGTVLNDFPEEDEDDMDVLVIGLTKKERKEFR